ncbi:uncharacterized protein LOC119674832 [Teleopsis dalmanni]|uniref:uncharacterized protein LOC119674832 n=1 Tax=Teleopsis dalmanni TaxID=139649 RepID=UPI0018CEB42C|nr:uncharacterized protein LOC119674832 [Teleopsis dalmanni]
MSAYTLQLFVILLFTQINYNQALPPEAVNSNAPTDTFYIRHGRSKVRHSNEKEHILRTWRTQNANITHNYAGNIVNENETSDNGRADFTSSISVPSGNGHLFGTGYWQHSESNDTITKRLTLTEPNATLKPFKTEPHATATVMSNTVSTMAPVTHKIRKLHKKKIMESIRNSVDKSMGIRFSNHHRSLAQAEQLQGRHIDLKEDKSNSHESNELSDGLQLADTLSLYDSLNDEDMYQNDEYFTTTAMDLTVKTENIENAADISEDLSLSTLLPALNLESEILNDDYKQNIEPETSTVGTMKTTTDAQRDTKHATAFSAKSILATPMENSEMKNKNSNHAGIEGNNKSLAIHVIKNKNEFKTEITENAQKHSRSNLIARVAPRPDTLEIKWTDSKPHLVSENGSEFGSVPQIPTSVGGFSSEPPAFIAPTEADWYESLSLGPSQSASTSVGGVGLDRQSMDMEEINFDDVGLNVPEDGIMDDGLFDNSNANGFPVSSSNDNNDEYSDEVNPFLAGAVDAANEDEIYNWDEISRNNRRNLMRGRDVVTKFLQIVETQHSLGSNCEAGTSLNLGEGVVDRYAQDRFRVEAEVAVNRANMLTRIFKMTGRGVQSDINLLHASVLSMVEFDDDIFAAGNCFDWNEHPTQPGLFCPFAYRLPPPNLGAILAKNLATEYHYLGNTSEWFFQARKNAEKVIARNEQYLKVFT